MKILYLSVVLVCASCCHAAAPEFIGPVLHWLYADASPSTDQLVLAGKAGMKERRLSLVYTKFGNQNFIFDIHSGLLATTDKNAEEFAVDQKLPSDPRSPERKFSFVEIAGPNEHTDIAVSVGISLCHGYYGILRWDAEKKIVAKESIVVKCCF